MPAVSHSRRDTADEAETAVGLRLPKSEPQIKPASSEGGTPEVWTVFQDTALIEPTVCMYKASRV
jgi:hypothetical protein